MFADHNVKPRRLHTDQHLARNAEITQVS